MRIILEKGRQNELISSAKENKTWEELANQLNLNAHYLYHELRKEIILLSEETYNHLCKLANKNFDRFIIKKLENNWGQSKGGVNSFGSLKKLPIIKFDDKLAEFVGAVLGDGHVEFYKKGKKVGVYHIRIAGDLIKDRDYHINYLKPLVKHLFNLEAKEILRIRPKSNGRYLDVASKDLVGLFNSMGIKSGDKIINQSTIPKWIFDNNKYLRFCVRGLIDTDGSIARMSQRDCNLLRIFLQIIILLYLRILEEHSFSWGFILPN